RPGSPTPWRRLPRRDRLTVRPGGYTDALRPYAARATEHRGAGSTLPEDPTLVKPRVVTDQPWDVPADVLVIPVAAPPEFDGALAELDRRAGGELAALVAFRELTGKRFATSLATAGDLPAGRLLVVGVGDAATLDREGVVRVAASAERRLGGRVVRSMAIWLT